MSELHLAEGSTEPPKDGTKWRLYSMAFCPFAQRARLILKLKNVPHDIVNIDLKKKPDWFLKLNPKGEVPVLDTRSEIVTESLDICDFLEKKFPNPPLYSSESQIAEDRQFLNNFAKIIPLYAAAVYKKNDNTFKEHIEGMIPHLEAMERELVKRGGKYYGGEKPGMVDYMVWPWAERAPIVGMVFKEKLPLENLNCPTVLKWAKEMKNDKVISEQILKPEKYYKIALMYQNGGTDVQYDSV